MLHAIETSGQIILQPVGVGVVVRFLGVRVLHAPLLVVIGNGHAALARRSGRVLQLLCLARLHANLLSEAEHLVEDHLAHVLHFVDDLEAKVERGRARRLVRGIVPDVQVPVLQRVLDRDPARRVKGQHAVQKIQSVRVGVRKQGLEGHARHVGEVPDVVLRARRSDARQRLLARRAQVIQDLIELVYVVATLEKGAPA